MDATCGYVKSCPTGWRKQLLGKSGTRSDRQISCGEREESNDAGEHNIEDWKNHAVRKLELIRELTPLAFVRIIFGIDPGFGGADLEIEHHKGGEEADDGKIADDRCVFDFFILVADRLGEALWRESGSDR